MKEWSEISRDTQENTGKHVNSFNIILRSNKVNREVSINFASSNLLVTITRSPSKGVVEMKDNL